MHWFLKLSHGDVTVVLSLQRSSTLAFLVLTAVIPAVCLMWGLPQLGETALESTISSDWMSAAVQQLSCGGFLWN